MTSVKKKLVFTLTFFILFFSVYSQKLEELVIEVDSVTNLITKPIPFDRKFILKIRTDVIPPYIDYIKHKGNRSWYKTIDYYIKKDSVYITPAIPKENFELRNEKGTNFLFVRFDKHPYKTDATDKKNDFLKPSSFYSVIVPKFNEVGVTILELFHKKDDSVAMKLYYEYSDEQFLNYGFGYMVPDIATMKLIAQNLLKPNFSKIDSLRLLVKSAEKDSSIIYPLMQNLLLANGMKSIVDTDTAAQMLNKTFDLSGMTKAIYELYHIDTVKGIQIIEGVAAIGNLSVEPKTKVSEKERLTNYTASIASLRQLKMLFELLIFQGRLTDTANNMRHITLLLEHLTNEQKNLKLITKEYNSIKDSIVKKSFFLDPTVVGGGTVIYDFKTRAKLQITPDFGYVVYGFQKGFTSFTPYLGFHINFRAVDKNIPFQNYPNKTIWHHLSFMTGWTLAGVAQQNKRENFFSSNSLLTGLGYKLSNAIRLNAGAMWFYKNDPNPLLDNRKIAYTVYTGISIDLDIKELLQDFTSLKPNIK